MNIIAWLVVGLIAGLGGVRMERPALQTGSRQTRRTAVDKGRAEGRERFELWVGAAVLANNLMRIAALLAKRSARKRKIA